MFSIYDSIKQNCCGCYACFNACPTRAIDMKENEDGFVFPKIENNLCINCMKCKKVCDFQNKINSGNYPIKAFAAINKNDDILLKSSSGGAFSALAEVVLEQQGIVFGCTIDKSMRTTHIYIDKKEDLYKMRGSKYVQSDIGTSYQDVKAFLNEGRLVLFSGTPCQIAGLKSYLGKNYDNLLTVDLICHGVPSNSLFYDYIKYENRLMEDNITEVSFRNKICDWKESFILTFNTNVKVNPAKSYYYNFFLNGYIYRESCYTCKYANSKRQGDFTIGDYWGIENIHTDIDIKKGVSLLTINTNKATKLVDEIKKKMHLKESDFEKAKEYNAQLNYPTKKTQKREKILSINREKGAKGLAQYHKRMVRIYNISRIIPSQLKLNIKKIFNI